VTPIFYSFRRCPYAMRARMGLLISGSRLEIREIALRDKPAAMLAASSKGTVPVLVLANRVIDESLDILRWALVAHDPEEWLARDDVALIAANDGLFKHHLDRYKYAARHGSDAREHATIGVAILAGLEERLATHANLCGATRGLTDIAIFPFVRQFAETDRAFFDAQPLPGVRRWLATHVASPLFERAMQRWPVWRDGDAAIRLK